MVEHDEMKKYLPKTLLMEKDTFVNLIDQYGDVIIKPDDGRRGRGVYRIFAIDTNKYEIHHEDRKITVEGKEQTYEYLRDKIGSQKYLVQRRISLATVQSRPMDVRVIVQRKKYRDTWKMTAIAVKVAGKGYIVTNIERSNGTILPFKDAIRKSSLKDYSSGRLMSDIERICVRSSERLSQLYPHHRIFGFDIGLDHKGDAWIIEVNRFPMMSHFRKLEDKAMYDRIMKYKES